VHLTTDILREQDALHITGLDEFDDRFGDDLIIGPLRSMKMCSCIGVTPSALGSIGPLTVMTLPAKSCRRACDETGAALCEEAGTDHCSKRIESSIAALI